MFQTYFIPKEGFLAGITLNIENVSINSEYINLLKFYGYDINSFNTALYPEHHVTTTEFGSMGAREETTLTTDYVTIPTTAETTTERKDEEISTEKMTSSIDSETPTTTEMFTEKTMGITETPAPITIENAEIIPTTDFSSITTQNTPISSTISATEVATEEITEQKTETTQANTDTIEVSTVDVMKTEGSVYEVTETTTISDSVTATNEVTTTGLLIDDASTVLNDKTSITESVEEADTSTFASLTSTQSKYKYLKTFWIDFEVINPDVTIP